MSGILRIAGGMKRSWPDLSESQILMRAMRDTNLAKLDRKYQQNDFSIFLGVLRDLFPEVDCPAIVNPSLQKAINEVIADPDPSYWGPPTESRYWRHVGRPNLVAADAFVAKTINLYEVLSVRHCVFVLGCAGSAKSELWKTLAAAQSFLKEGGGRTLYNALNPKAVTSNDLYGKRESVYERERRRGVCSRASHPYYASLGACRLRPPGDQGCL